MKVGEILKKIFGQYPSTQTVSWNDFTLEEHIHQLNGWLNDKFAALNQPPQPNENALAAKGCLGPNVKTFEIRVDKMHTANISNDLLTVQSQTVFSTIPANCCVYRGKWMYEVQLLSKGIMQIGWCSSRCQFTPDTGVGDTRNSYGWDGSKQRLWHIQTKKYGPKWLMGDIIGVCLDMDGGTLQYYRNGSALGVAFSDIERGAGIALFPAVSLSFNESITANFGSAPFRYPVAGYDRLQSCPVQFLRNANSIMQFTISLAKQMAMKNGRMVSISKESSASASLVHQIIAGSLVALLGKCLHISYVLEDVLYASVRKLCEEKGSNHLPGSLGSTLGIFLSLLWTHLDARLTKMILARLLLFLSSVYKQTPENSHYEKQRSIIVTVTCLCRHPKTKRYYLENRFFRRHCLPNLLYINQPDEHTLIDLLPDKNVWITGEDNAALKTKYLTACSTLQKNANVLYSLQMNLVEFLMKGNKRPFSRYFAEKMRRYVIENCSLQRHATSTSSSMRSSVALSFICIVLDVVRRICEHTDDHGCFSVDPEQFYRGSLTYTICDRVGGVLSFLNKTFYNELEQHIGNREIFAHAVGETDGSNNSLSVASYPITALYDIFDETIEDGSSNRTLDDVLMSMMTGGNVQRLSSTKSTSSRTTITSTMESVDDKLSLNIAVDSCIILYHVAAHKYVVQIANLRDSIGNLSEMMEETRRNESDVMHCESLLADEMLRDLRTGLANRFCVLRCRSFEMARKQMWYRAVALNEQRQRLLNWMLLGIFQTLSQSSADGPLFAFVPEVYLNAVPMLLDAGLDFGHPDLARENHQTDDMLATLRIGTEFLANHATGDARIVLASCKDSILQALGAIACHSVGMAQLEEIGAQTQQKLVRGLLRTYENRAWGQTNWLLIRFWLGEGFAFRDARVTSVWQSAEQREPSGLLRSRGKIGLMHHVAPACPSRHYQDMIRAVLLADEPFSTCFLNSLLSQLNWAFSEFVLLLQEIATNARQTDRPGRQQLTAETLKACSMSFELSVSLMRTLEMIIAIVPNVCLDTARPNSDLLLNRVLQLVSQVLARVTMQSGVFQQVIDFCLPELASVTHFAIVTASLGILLALFRDQMLARTSSRICASLASSSTLSSDKDENVDIDVVVTARVSHILLTDPSFQLSQLDFALGRRLGRVSFARSSDGGSRQRVRLGNFDPLTRSNIDPLTNEVRVVDESQRTRRSQRPIVHFSLTEYASHIDERELRMVERLIELLRRRQSIISETTLPSDDSVCPICYSKSVSAIFEPCHHQSCANCIVQHLMNQRQCFYCKVRITKVANFAGESIYECPPMSPLLAAHREANDNE